MENRPYTYQQPSPPPTNGLAIGSLVLSILGLVGILPIIGSIVGLILGYMAQRQIEESGGAQGGEGLAKAGIIIGWISIGLALLALCLVILFMFVLPVLGLGGLGFCAALGNVQ